MMIDWVKLINKPEPTELGANYIVDYRTYNNVMIYTTCTIFFTRQGDIDGKV